VDILGLIAGFIGSKIVNRRGEGLILDIILGIVGAVVGGWLFRNFGASGVTGLNIYSLAVAVVGATSSLWFITLSDEWSNPWPRKALLMLRTGTVDSLLDVSGQSASDLLEQQLCRKVADDYREHETQNWYGCVQMSSIGGISY
jgi:uncharacterized membrane protein YeaQ/YmgE (transglycosylase-associated protein family)